MPSSSFFFARDRVDPLQGFIRPTLRQTGLKPHKSFGPCLILETHVAVCQKVGSMKPPRGPTRSGNHQKHPPLPVSDAEGRVGETFKRPSLRAVAQESQIDTQPDPSRKRRLSMTSMPLHSKESRTRPFASRTHLRTFFRKLEDGKHKRSFWPNFFLNKILDCGLA